MSTTSLNTGNILPPCGANKGTVLAAGEYLRVGDYFYSHSQWYGFYAVLQANGDLRFYYSQVGMIDGEYKYIDANMP